LRRAFVQIADSARLPAAVHVVLRLVQNYLICGTRRMALSGAGPA